MTKDKLFAARLGTKEDFQFNSSTAAVFDDMLRRGVPYYDEVQRMTAELAARLAQKNSTVCDLGCSTGTTLLLLSQKITDPGIKLVGVDNSAAMLAEAARKLKKHGVLSRCSLQCADLNRKLEFKRAGVHILNLTLQFIRPLRRPALLKRLRDSLVRGGGCIVIEKVLSRDTALNRLYIDLYYDFKRRHGYSKLEIAQKREALENVLIPYTIDENIELLKKAGFSHVDTFFEWYNFAGFIALK